MKDTKEIQKIVTKVRVAETDNKYKTDLTKTIEFIKETYQYSIDIGTISVDDFQNIESLLGLLSGQVERLSESGYVIRISQYESILRQRFTLAHELGHILLGHLEEGDNLKEPAINIINRDVFFDKSDPREKEANRFGAELLMPENEFREFFDNKGESIDMSLIELGSEKFDVSKSAIMTRLKFLDLKF